MSALLMKCSRCDGRGHMDDSRDMDNGYGRWWRSEPTQCEWCGGKGADDALKLASLEIDGVMFEVEKLRARLKERMQRMRELKRIIAREPK